MDSDTSDPNCWETGRAEGNADDPSVHILQIVPFLFAEPPRCRCPDAALAVEAIFVGVSCS